MNKMLNAMKEQNNITYTENSGLTYRSTMDGLMDLFALGGSYRSRSDEDCIFLFKKAFDENPTYALKCLFYLRDCRGGQGERRFFRVIIRWLANNHTDAIARNLQYVPFMGRWDDLYIFVGTKLEKQAFKLMYDQLALDVQCKTPSLLGKWLKSENTSSQESRNLAKKTRIAFGMTSKQYRKTLSVLRERIRVVERLMSQNRWDEIEFDKIPSKAGLIYRNAFAQRDIIKAKYEKFAKDENTKVNAKALYSCEVVHKALEGGNRYTWYRSSYKDMDETERAMINKYWDNLGSTVFKEAIFDGVAVVDTSRSMWSTRGQVNIAPMDVACSLGMYCAEKCNPNSPWYGHYISFSRQARLVPIEGIDFVDKCRRIRDADLCENTNIESVFDLILRTAIKNHLSQSDMPKNIIVISDMEFDRARGNNWGAAPEYESIMEQKMKEFAAAGYAIPKLVFWNVDARNDRIPMRDNGKVTFISGYSASLFDQLLTGKTGLDLIMEKLNSERYSCIH